VCVCVCMCALTYVHADGDHVQKRMLHWSLSEQHGLGYQGVNLSDHVQLVCACQADDEEKRRIQEDEKRAAREAKEAALAAEHSRQRKAIEDAARAQREENDLNLRPAAQEKERR
jgi:hypothetical protein